MKLELQRPLVFFDLETTGVDIATARIVQIAMHRMEPDGSSMEYEQLVNPGIPIPPGATQVHGIRDADVATAPRFADVAPRVMQIWGGTTPYGTMCPCWPMSLSGLGMTWRWASVG